MKAILIFMVIMISGLIVLIIETIDLDKDEPDNWEEYTAADGKRYFRLKQQEEQK